MKNSKTPATPHKIGTALIFVLTLLACSSTVSAHHGTAVSYEQEEFITVTGTVTQFRWRNPHSALFLDIKNEAGETVNYAIELASPVLMSRSSGWTRNTFRPGDTVQFRVHPSRTGAPVGECLFNCEVLINGEPPVSALENQD
jgi:hypothetical protein